MLKPNNLAERENFGEYLFEISITPLPFIRNNPSHRFSIISLLPTSTQTRKIDVIQAAHRYNTESLAYPWLSLINDVSPSILQPGMIFIGTGISYYCALFQLHHHFHRLLFSAPSKMSYCRVSDHKFFLSR